MTEVTIDQDGNVVMLEDDEELMEWEAVEEEHPLLSFFFNVILPCVLLVFMSLVCLLGGGVD